jgi:hypothetical protein
MRKAFLAVLLLCAATVGAQDYIRYYPPAIPAGILSSSGTALTSTVPLTLPYGTTANVALRFSNAFPNYGWKTDDAGSWDFVQGGGVVVRMNSAFSLITDTATFAMGVSGDTVLRRDTANTLALRNGTAAQTFNVYNSFTTAGSNYGRFSISATATGTDLIGTGAGATAATGAFRSMQGSVAKALTDAAAAASVVRIAVATNGYIGGRIMWTATSTDGTDQLATSGEQFFSGVDKAGTVTCGTGSAVGTATAYTTAKTLVCTVSVATATTNCDIQATCTNDTAGSQAISFDYRLDMPIVSTVTPQ